MTEGLHQACAGDVAVMLARPCRLRLSQGMAALPHVEAAQAGEQGMSCQVGGQVSGSSAPEQGAMTCRRQDGTADSITEAPSAGWEGLGQQDMIPLHQTPDPSAAGAARNLRKVTGSQLCLLHWDAFRGQAVAALAALAAAAGVLGAGRPGWRRLLLDICSTLVLSSMLSVRRVLCLASPACECRQPGGVPPRQLYVCRPACCNNCWLQLRAGVEGEQQ